MKVETPQILWHNEENKNAPILSISLLESGVSDDNLLKLGTVLATAGNNEIHLWKVSFCANQRPSSSSSPSSSSPNILQANHATKIEHLATLTRHDNAVNAVRFSPDGLHLASGGDSGSVVIYSVPPTKRGNHNGRHYWSTVTQEKDLSCKVIPCDQVYDMDWSSDSKRLVVGRLDHTVLVLEDTNYETNRKADANHKPQLESQWTCVYRNGRDHSHYVQGVAYDPKGVYVATMSCDRTVRVFGRKTKSKKKATSSPQQWLTESKLEFSKGKQIKYRVLPVTEDGAKPKKLHLFAEESTSESFFRRLRFTADGAFLVTPTAIWHSDEQERPSMATCLFARHKYDQPAKVLLGMDKPSRVVCPGPIRFDLPDSCSGGRHMGLPYRSVFAVLTEKSVLVYDTFHTKPISVARGLHYSGLSDAVWTPDGHTLLVSSMDGYISVLSFEQGELGVVYRGDVANRGESLRCPPKDHKLETSLPTPTPRDEGTPSATSSSTKQPRTNELQETVHILQPKKKKKKRIVPTIVSP